jgi:type I restriction enzyme S subunit
MEIKQGYKQTDIGVIPEDWEICSFSDTANKNVNWSITGGPFGSNLKASDYTTDGVQIIQLQNIGDGEFLNDYTIFTSDEKADELLSCNIYPGDIILSKMGDPVARACFIPNTAKRFLMASDGIRLVVNEREFSKRFVHDYINSKYFRNRAFEVSHGSTRLRIGLPELKKLLVIKPPKAEQTAIATALSDMDDLINSLSNLIEKKKAIKQGAMQQLLKPKEGWVVKKLGEITKLFTKQTGFDYSAFIKPSLVQTKTDETIPFIQNKDFNNKWINFNTDYYIPLSVATQFPKILLDEKSLLISISGSIGNIGVYDSEKLAFIGGAVAILKFKDTKIIDWILYYLKSDAGQKKLFGSVKAGSHQNLILDDIRKVEIPLPLLEEQVHITTLLDDMENEILSLEQNLSKYQMLKQGMMQELLTGKTRLV